MESEVKQYSQYLEGDVYGFAIEDPDGNDMDSCWGFYGHAYCLQEAKSIADSLAADYFETVAIHNYSRKVTEMVTTV